jgi:phosphoesterase RecJ-like protein
LVTDTIGFRTENVTPEVLRLAANLQELGAPLAAIQLNALNVKSFAAIRYWGYGLNRISMKNGVVWSTLLVEDRATSGYSIPDDADLINLLNVIEGSRIAVILIEQPDGKVKVSWRSSSGINVSKVAEQFGGGGHTAAAGAMIDGKIVQVSKNVLEATFNAVK